MVYICPWHTWFRKSSTLRVDFSPHSVLHHPPCCGDAKVFGLRGKFSFGDGVSTVLSGLHYYWICCKPWSKAIRSTPFCHWLQHWYKYLVSYQISQLIWRTKNLKSSPSFFFAPEVLWVWSYSLNAALENSHTLNTYVKDEGMEVPLSVTDWS